MNEEEFRKMALEKGYGEPELYEVEPGPEEEMHAHDYSVLFDRIHRMSTKPKQVL